MERLPLNLGLRITQFFIQEKPSALAKLFKTDPHSSLQFFLPDLSLFMIRFVMAQCSASEFCSQAFTFLGNRRLLVTTVHLGACRKLAAHEHQNGLSGGSSQHEQGEELQFTASIHTTKKNFRCVLGDFFPSLSITPLQCSLQSLWPCRPTVPVAENASPPLRKPMCSSIGQHENHPKSASPGLFRVSDGI